MKFFVAVFLSIGLATSALADDPSPPPPPAAPNTKVDLNNRIYLGTTSIYDPTYGLGRVGVVKNNVVEFLPFRFLKTLPSPGALLSRNFQVYTFNSEEGKSADLKIPIIGGFSASGTDILHIVMEDISEVYLDKGYRPGSCEIWGAINHALVDAGDQIIFTDHAVLTTMAYGAASKYDAKAQFGIGDYFSAGAGIYKSASVTNKVPLIALDGIKFTVKDPKTFCLPSSDRRLEATTDFTTLRDLNLPVDANFKVQGMPLSLDAVGASSP